MGLFWGTNFNPLSLCNFVRGEPKALASLKHSHSKTRHNTQVHQHKPMAILSLKVRCVVLRVMLSVFVPSVHEMHLIFFERMLSLLVLHAMQVSFKDTILTLSVRMHLLSLYYILCIYICRPWGVDLVLAHILGYRGKVPAFQYFAIQDFIN